MSGERYVVEFYATATPKPIAIWDTHTRDGQWHRLVANLRDGSPTMAEVEAMVAALNRLPAASQEHER